MNIININFKDTSILCKVDLSENATNLFTETAGCNFQVHKIKINYKSITKSKGPVHNMMLFFKKHYNYSEICEVYIFIQNSLVILRSAFFVVLF